MHTEPRSTTFLLDSGQCELLLDLEATGSVRALAESMRRDISAVNRQLQRIAETSPVLEKHNGRWTVSALGRELNEWTREASVSQQRILEKRPSIRIAAAREFSALILAPKLDELLDLNHRHEVSLLTSEDSESLLLQRKADIAFERGRPTDPAVRFKSVKQEPFCFVASPAFAKKHGVRNFLRLLELPYLRYSKASAPEILKLSRELACVYASFDDISGTRSACLAGLGWTILPSYSVHAEIRAKRLKRLEGPKLLPGSYGVWWLRDRKGLDAWAEAAATWLDAQDLG